MTKGFSGITIAFLALFAIAPQLSIIALVKATTGWTMPKWLAVSIAAIGVAATIASALATFGVTVPAAVLKAAAISKSVVA